MRSTKQSATTRNAGERLSGDDFEEQNCCVKILFMTYKQSIRIDGDKEPL